MYQYIDSQQALTDFVAQIRSSEWVVIDTEFIREKSYYPQLCLIQIAAGEHMACIDPIAIDDLSELDVILHDPNVVKVFHAAQQDLEILYYRSGKVPAPIFDTQPAASILGIGEQIGYAGLVEKVLGVTLAKAESRTDWSKRPLSKAQLEYAIDDVRYLQQLYPVILDKLKDGGRTSWPNRDFERLTNPDTYQLKERTRWQKVKGLQNLNRQQLSVLRELAAWREIEAAKRNRPRRWIVSDEILVDLARLQPSDLDGVQAIRGLNPDQAKRNAQTWFDCMTAGREAPESEWPEMKRRTKPSLEIDILADLLMVVIRIEAEKQGITVSAIASKKQVVTMLQEGRMTLSDDWRGELVNDAIASVRAQKTVLTVLDGKAQLLTNS
ncbi:ribonuclease D [Leucothrix sargassi]|nr:ribonuclease D [Leucothrix sargassi]